MDTWATIVGYLAITSLLLLCIVALAWAAVLLAHRATKQWALAWFWRFKTPWSIVKKMLAEEKDHDVIQRYIWRVDSAFVREGVPRDEVQATNPDQLTAADLMPKRDQ